MGDEPVELGGHFFSEGREPLGKMLKFHTVECQKSTGNHW